MIEVDKYMQKLLPQLKTISISVDIHEYDKDEFLRLLLDNKAARFVLSKYLNKEQIEFTSESKMLCINVCKKASEKLNELIKKNAIKGLIKKNISITGIRYIKKGKGMKLQVEIRDIDIDNMLDVLIGSAKEKSREDALKNGKGDDNQNGELIFTLLKSINKDVPTDEKIRLVQLLLGWINSNGLVQKALDTLIAENTDMGSKLGPLKLNIGDINILTD